jgi:hypothetical protein
MEQPSLLKGASMSKRIPKVVAVTAVTAALAVGGAGVAQASSHDHHGHKNDACKSLHGKKKRECERKHHR